MQSVHQVKEPNPSSYSVYKSKWDESCGKQSQVICNSLYFVKTDDIVCKYKKLQMFTLVPAVLQAIKSADSLVLRKEWVGDFDCTYTAENLGTDDNIIELGKEWINIMHSEDEKSKPDNIGWNLCFCSIFLSGLACSYRLPKKICFIFSLHSSGTVRILFHCKPCFDANSNRSFSPYCKIQTTTWRPFANQLFTTTGNI